MSAMFLDKLHIDVLVSAAIDLCSETRMDRDRYRITVTAHNAQGDGHIAHGTGFAVETALSSSKYRNRVRAARRAEFQIGVIFIYGNTPALNIRRVKQRVQIGGHSVPPHVIAARWHRSIASLTWFSNRADYLLVIDNLGQTLRFVIRKPVGQSWQVLASANAPVVDAAGATCLLHRRVR